MNPTFSPTFGPAGLGGGGLGASTTGGGSSLPSGFGGSGGGVLMTTMGSLGAAFGTGGGGGASLAASSGWSMQSCSSRYSALILSSELDGTLAAAMPSDLALAIISLFSKPSFFEMS